MRVHEETARLLDVVAAAGAPKLYDLSAEQAREMVAAGTGVLDLPPEPVAKVEPIDIPSGRQSIAARLYVPEQFSSPDVFVFYHGGGWMVCDLETHDRLCRVIANRLGTRLLSVDYRLAPEHPFPAAFDDSLAAALWAAGSPPELGERVPAIILGGDSAGGNLAAAVAAHWDGPVPTRAQFLIYPVTDLSRRRASYDHFGEGFLLDARIMALFIDAYVADEQDRRAPRVSPLLAPTDKVPPTVIVTAGLDVLRDEGRAYAARLIEAGIETHFFEAKGFPHGFANSRQALPSSVEVLERALASLSEVIAADR